MKPTREQILQARTRAEDFGTEALEARYSVDWHRTNKDARKGTTHAWTQAGVYLGQFKGHAMSLEHGAAVTKFAGVWFIWKIIETGPVREEAAAILRAAGIPASYEHPGYIAVITDAGTTNFGTVNGDYGAEWFSSDRAAAVFELSISLTRSATAPELADAITTWLKAVL